MVTWVIEPTVFGAEYDSFRSAIAELGHREVVWDDDWWNSPGRMPQLSGETVVFHGSLGNADRIHRELDWTPGAFCDANAFACSSWYREAGEHLLHRRWVLTTVRSLCDQANQVGAELGNVQEVFVRPDSPLKEFSGRVVSLEGLQPQALDHGFYYDDIELPIIVAPVVQVASEYRFVVVDGAVVAGSGYVAQGRQAIAGGEPWTEAQVMASRLKSPEAVYVLDVVESDGRLRLLELNPFSGADLYASDAAAVVRDVARFAEGT